MPSLYHISFKNVCTKSILFLKNQKQNTEKFQFLHQNTFQKKCFFQSLKIQAVGELRERLGWLTVSVRGNELHFNVAFMLVCQVVQLWPFHLFQLIWKSFRPASPFIWNTAHSPVNTHMQSCLLSATYRFFWKVSLTTSV